MQSINMRFKVIHCFVLLLIYFNGSSKGQLLSKAISKFAMNPSVSGNNQATEQPQTTKAAAETEAATKPNEVTEQGSSQPDPMKAIENPLSSLVEGGGFLVQFASSFSEAVVRNFKFVYFTCSLIAD